MNQVFKFTLAGFLAATVSGAAVAQTAAGVEAGAGADAGAGAGPAVETAAGAAVGLAGAHEAAALDVERVIAGLRAEGDISAEVVALNGAHTAQVLRLPDLRAQAAGDPEALDEALAGQEMQRLALQTAVGANAALSGALQEQGFSAENVIAASTGAGGEVTLIVDDE
jgi:hypothetical protein